MKTPTVTKLARFEEVSFYGDTLTLTVDDAGTRFVGVRAICESMGIDPKSQQRRIQTDPKFSWGRMTSTGSDGKQYDMFSIALDHLSGWLFSINAKKVKEEVREKLLRYQHECHTTLSQRFLPEGGITDAVQMNLAAIVTKQTDLYVQLYNKHVKLEGRVDLLEGRLDSTQKVWGSAAGQNLAACKNWKN